MDYEQLQGVSLPLKVLSPSNRELTITAFNSQAALTVDGEGNESSVSMTSLSGFSIPSETIALKFWVNVYPDKIGSRVFKDVDKAIAKASESCLGQKLIETEFEHSA